MADKPQLSTTARFVAALALAAFGIFVVYLVAQVDEDDVDGAAGLETLGPGAPRDAAASVAARHAELARRLFP